MSEHAMPEMNGKSHEEGSSDPSFFEFVSCLPEDLEHTTKFIGGLAMKHGIENVSVRIEAGDTARVYYPRPVE